MRNSDKFAVSLTSYATGDVNLNLSTNLTLSRNDAPPTAGASATEQKQAAQATHNTIFSHFILDTPCIFFDGLDMFPTS
jgi:hypothetical protein